MRKNEKEETGSGTVAAGRHDSRRTHATISILWRSKWKDDGVEEIDLHPEDWMHVELRMHKYSEEAERMGRTKK